MQLPVNWDFVHTLITSNAASAYVIIERIATPVIGFASFSNADATGKAVNNRHGVASGEYEQQCSGPNTAQLWEDLLGHPENSTVRFNGIYHVKYVKFFSLPSASWFSRSVGFSHQKLQQPLHNQTKQTPTRMDAIFTFCIVCYREIFVICRVISRRLNKRCPNELLRKWSSKPFRRRRNLRSTITWSRFLNSSSSRVNQTMVQVSSWRIK